MMERFERKKFTERFDCLVGSRKKNMSVQNSRWILIHHADTCYRFCMWAVHNDKAGDGRSGRSKNNATEEHTACEYVMNDEGSWNMGNKLCNWNSKFCRYNTQ
jgi:hypothetical protein